MCPPPPTLPNPSSYPPVFFFGEGPPRSLYRLSESALPEEFDEEEEVREEMLLAEWEREREAEVAERDRADPDRDLEKEVEEPEREPVRDRDRLDPLELALCAFGLGLKIIIIIIIINKFSIALFPVKMSSTCLITNVQQMSENGSMLPH